MAPGPSPEVPRNKLRFPSQAGKQDQGRQCQPDRAHDMPMWAIPPRHLVFSSSFTSSALTKLAALICKASERESSKNSQALRCVTEPLDAAQAIMALHRNVTRPSKHEDKPDPVHSLHTSKAKKKGVM